MILINDDCSSFVCIDDAEAQAIMEAIGRLADAIAQLAGGFVEQLTDALDDLPPVPDAPAWERAPVLRPTGAHACLMAARRYVPP